MEKLISMCFPIYNRIETFKYTFTKTMEEVIALNSDEIEVIVSVNPDEHTIAETKKFLSEMQKRAKIIVNINESNIGIAGNGRKVFELASGKYIWMIGDDDFLLPGCVGRVLREIKKHPDIGWFHLEHARLDGLPNDKNSKVIFLSNDMFHKSGYFPNGKETVIEAHNISGANTLFSSANLYLREAWKELAGKYTDGEHNPQLSATFYSASKGGAYLDHKISIVAGGERSWNSQVDYSTAINYFEDMYFTIGYGFSRQEIDRMIRHTMRHEKLLVWFRVCRLFCKDTKLGKKASSFFLHVMPLQTIITMAFLPFIGVYLLFRHSVRNRAHKRACEEYIHSADADPQVVERIQGKPSEHV